jgi:hypothetical protein
LELSPDANYQEREDACLHGAKWFTSPELGLLQLFWRRWARTSLIAASLGSFVTQVEQLTRGGLPYFSLEGRA